MKNFYKYSILILLIFIPIDPLLSQWTQTNETDFGSVNSFTVHAISGDSILFEATSTGVFRTSDNGGKWDSVGLTYKNVHTKVNRHKFICITDAGLFRFNNYSLTWNYDDYGLKGENIKILISNDSTLFAGTFSGVFYSTDNGETWIKSSSPDPRFIERMVIMDTNIFASQGLALDDPGLFISTNYQLKANNFIQTKKFMLLK